jgi:hypothetical protein
MNAQELLQQIADYCRHSGLAESTFGRRAVNDGKLTARLRNGGRITTETLDRIRGFMESNRGARARAAASRADRTDRARASSDYRATRSAAQFPLLRQSAEIPAVRQHLQREVGCRQPGRAGTG